MAEEIVACPGCGKKFKIPDGAPGGAFQCTACNANVPYGKAARPTGPARGAPAKAAAPAAKPAAKGPVKSAHAAPAAKSARGAAGKRHARATDDEETDDRGHRGHGGKDRNKDNKTVLWVSVGVVGLVAVIGIALAMRKKPEPAPVAHKPDPTVVTPPPAPVAPVVQPTTPAAAGAAGSGDAPKVEGASGIGGTKPSDSTSAAGWSSKGDEIYIHVEDIAGVTPEERSDMDKLVATFVDRDSGKPGIDARNKLKKLGRKAVPALLSAFETHWKGKKWDDDLEKFASFQVQQLMVDISKADRPGGDFVARYVPQDPKSVDAKTFERAARMWVNWWHSKGKNIEKFKDFPE
ncbi:MAG: zinc-ribbon domain-containing protein [Planctomycetes bacterium]|nr:zinc-ribbon domain-containing protein [Planctomycetota bacterium]